MRDARWMMWVDILGIWRAVRGVNAFAWKLGFIFYANCRILVIRICIKYARRRMMMMMKKKKKKKKERKVGVEESGRQRLRQGLVV